MKKIALFLIIIITVSGCVSAPRISRTPKYLVNISSLKKEGETFNDRKYFIAPGMKDVNQGDLQFNEYSAYVKRALEQKGFNVVDRQEDADAVIFLSYGVGNPVERNISFSLPVFGQTGIASSSTIGSAYSFGNTANLRATTTYTPSYGIVGSSEHQLSIVLYNRYITLDTYDLVKMRKTKESIEIWKTAITSKGRNDDLRYVFPALITAAIPYIGEDTGQRVRVTIKDGDKRILAIKGTTNEL